MEGQFNIPEDCTIDQRLCELSAYASRLESIIKAVNVPESTRILINALVKSAKEEFHIQ